MITNKIYDPTVEKLASIFPRFDVSDAVGARNTLNDFLEAMAAKGAVRPTDDRVEEIERTIPGPGGAPDVPIRVYFLGKDRKNVSPYAAPARAQDLSGLPSAYVMTCEHDPMRDEAIIYAMRLMADGVQVELHNYPGTVHSFDFLTPSEVSTRAVNESVEVFKRAMA